MKKFTRYVDLDSSTTVCPCNSSFVIGDGETEKLYEDWEREHSPHVDTKKVTEMLTGDGARCGGADALENYDGFMPGKYNK